MNNLMVIDGIEVRRDAYGRYSLNDLHRKCQNQGAGKVSFQPTDY
ncbi:hypothetical protein ACNJPQ_08265 [Escherichia coli]